MSGATGMEMGLGTQGCRGGGRMAGKCDGWQVKLVGGSFSLAILALPLNTAQNVCLVTKGMPINSGIWGIV